MFYSAHSSPPFIHSNTSPTVKIIINMVAIGRRERMGDVRFAAGRGKRRAISRSNNKNSIATRKNRKEKGSRADFNGSNPHS